MITQETPTWRRLLTLDETAEILGVSRSMVRKLVDQGKLKSAKIGDLVRIIPEELDRYLASLKVG